MQYMPNVVPRLDSSSIWCAQIFALNTTTRSRHNRHQVEDCISEGKAQGGGEDICGSECQSRWPNIIKTGAREGSNCCCANIGAYKCTENALNCTRHAARRGKREGAAGVHSALHEYY